MQPTQQPSEQPTPSNSITALRAKREKQLSAAINLDQSMRDAWSPANAVEEHLVRKIAGLGVTIESVLEHIARLDPDTKANLISSFSLTVIRLQKTQTTLETELRAIQSQRGIRATHPLTCEHLPAQADARPYVRQEGSRPTVFKPLETIVAPEDMPNEARQLLETHFGTRIYKPSERANGKFMITPKLIEEIAAKLQPARTHEQTYLRPSVSICG